MSTRLRQLSRLGLPLLLMLGASCGRSPSGPSSPESFLTGTWRGTVVIQVNPNAPGAGPPTSAATTWTFEAVPQTNLQTFQATIRSEHPWLPITMTATAALGPGNSPPVHISTQGNYASPRGCQGTFGSAGTAEATRIEADFTGVDCQLSTFTGSVVLTKQ
jgi:hypothetical protein